MALFYCEINITLLGQELELPLLHVEQQNLK